MTDLSRQTTPRRWRWQTTLPTILRSFPRCSATEGTLQNASCSMRQNVAVCHHRHRSLRNVVWVSRWVCDIITWRKQRRCRCHIRRGTGQPAWPSTSRRSIALAHGSSRCGSCERILRTALRPAATRTKPVPARMRRTVPAQMPMGRTRTAPATTRTRLTKRCLSMRSTDVTRESAPCKCMSSMTS